jgi:hypothetical protein
MIMRLRVAWMMLKAAIHEWRATRREGGYGGLTDSRGYLVLGTRKVHVDALRDVDVNTLSAILGLSVEQLRAWARGPGVGLNLPWGQWDR